VAAESRRMSNPIQNGLIAEQKFILQALKNGWVLSRPLLGVEKYDFIADYNGKLRRVQVKLAYIDEKNRNVVCIRGCHGRTCKRKPTHLESDILVVVCFGDFYIIPTKTISHIKSNICVSNNGKYKGFLNNWSF
jgi:hypothetical protein